MILKRKLLFTLIILTQSFFLISIAPKIIAYPGQGDCYSAHPLTILEIPVDNGAHITLDGTPSESFWTDPKNSNGFHTIKLAETKFGIEIPEIYTINATFIMNSQYLYILMIWIDKTPQYEESGNKDGLAFCWDINTVNFSAYFITDMNTNDTGGGRVDAWRWVYSSYNPTDQSYFCIDDCFDESGWINDNPEPKDVEVAYSVGLNSYTLEIRRKLITNDEYDVQFNEKKLYKFNLALFNDTKDEDHAISWTYAIDLREPVPTSIPGLQIGLLLFIVGISIVLNIKLINKNTIKKTEYANA
jgi:hypothetical protein